MFDLTKFSVSDMIRCSAALRRMSDGAKSMEDVADKTVRYFYDALIDGESGQRACALVRLYKTHPFGALDAAAQACARAYLDDARRDGDAEGGEAPDARCFALLATAGEKPQWNSRKTSVRHKAIPLSSEAVLERAPMLSALMRQMGVPTAALMADVNAALRELEQKKFDMFHVERAEDSAFVPDQDDFVRPCGIRSVLGFGGVLPTADVFAVVLFTKVRVDRERASLFNTFPLSSKLALLRLLGGPVFS